MSSAGSIRPVFVFLVLLFPAWGCWTEVYEPPHPLQRNMLTSLVIPATPVSRPLEVVPPPTVLEYATYGMRPEACEKFEVKVEGKGRRKYRRVRKHWSHRDERRFKKLIDLVSREMGADARLFKAWAQRESSYRPSAIHVLDGDIRGATTAWRKYQYSKETEDELQQRLQRKDARDSEYWEIKAMLARVQTFRDNPYFNDIVEYDLRLPNGTRSRDFASIWAFGYGPFGFNPTYYIPLWDTQSPPWIFCGDDGIVAIVTAIWAAREHQKECIERGVGGSYLALNRRFGTGHCSNTDPNARFRKRLSAFGVNPDATARLGRKWARESTDRGQLLSHLRQRARQEGILAMH